MEEDCFHLGVKGVVIDRDKKILLLERKPLNGAGYWDLPGGRIHKGESQVDCLRRELREEIGFEERCKISPILMAMPKIRVNEHIGLIFSTFLVEVEKSFVPFLSDEHVGYTWLIASKTVSCLKNRFPLDFLDRLLLL